MTLIGEINQLQSAISELINQIGLSPRSINLSLRSSESGFEVLSITWDYPPFVNSVTNSIVITQEQFEKYLVHSIFLTGIKPFHCSLTIFLESRHETDNLHWKFNESNRNYLKINKKYKDININIQFISTTPNEN